MSIPGLPVSPFPPSLADKIYSPSHSLLWSFLQSSVSRPSLCNVGKKDVPRESLSDCSVCPWPRPHAKEATEQMGSPEAGGEHCEQAVPSSQHDPKSPSWAQLLESVFQLSIFLSSAICCQHGLGCRRRQPGWAEEITSVAWPLAAPSHLCSIPALFHPLGTSLPTRAPYSEPCTTADRRCCCCPTNKHLHHWQGLSPGRAASPGGSWQGNDPVSEGLVSCLGAGLAAGTTWLRAGGLCLAIRWTQPACPCWPPPQPSARQSEGRAGAELSPKGGNCQRLAWGG